MPIRILLTAVAAILFAATLLRPGGATPEAVAATTVPPAVAATASGVTIDGKVRQILHLTAEDLARLPAVTLDMAFKTKHGNEKGRYTGVSLWSLLEQAGFAEAPESRAYLRQTLLATGTDGYGVAIAIAELDPRFEGKGAIIAYARDGHPLGNGGLRLVIPGDLHGGRSVRDLVHIELR